VKKTSEAVFSFVVGLVAVVSAGWLLAAYVHARRVEPVEKALIDTLKTQARTDPSVQKILQPELDRQTKVLAARRLVYRRTGLVSLISGAVFLLWRQWRRPARVKMEAARVKVKMEAGSLDPADPAHPALKHLETAEPIVRAYLKTLARTRAPAPLDLSLVDEIVRAEGRTPEATIPILQAIQSRYRYLPDDALRRVAEITEITPAQLTGVSTFYDQFRHRPVGDHILRVCEGTACHVTGAVEVGDEIRRCLEMRSGEDTDPSGLFTIERVACVGSCSLAPVVTIDEAVWGHVSPLSATGVLRAFLDAERERPGNGHGSRRRAPAVNGPGQGRGDDRIEIRIGVGSCGVASGARQVLAAVDEAVQSLGGGAAVKAVGCAGLCHREPLVEVVRNGHRSLYGNVLPEDVRRIVRLHVKPRGFLLRIREGLADARARVFEDEAWRPAGDRAVDAAPYLAKQVRVVLENCGRIDPLSLEEYEARGGMRALADCLTRLTPQAAIDEVRASGLRGRGGAGFPTAVKWDIARRAPGTTKYVICNGDEGDPGAFMDRAVLEGDPFRVIEGLILAAYAIGAGEGFVYVRREYPIAVRHVRAAIETATARGLLGTNILGSGLAFTLQVREGAGAFVCGEETALIQSIEGRRGMPRLRPPFPAQSGLWGRPTVINNVETLACLPWIFREGAEAFAAMGTASSKGTKVFSLAGRVKRGGLIEVPMGITIREVVEDIGGGITDGRSFKAVLIGGPSGGCLPARLADTPIDYEQLASTGAIMGSGGLVVLDDRDCAVEIARYFVSFTQRESCGKCTFCRIGTKRMLEILERISAGQGRPSDLRTLEELSGNVRRGSLCGLGQTAPNPVVTTLRYFRDEYDAHIRDKRCPAARCKALIHYEVLETCTGCTLCAQACPVGAILAQPYERHVVIDDRCTRCGMCLTACPERAIKVA
jgi:NADH-quinone oxidoreductase subunit F